MALTDVFDPTLLGHEPDTVIALAEHLQESFPEEPRTQELLQLSRQQEKPRHRLESLRFAIQCSFTSLLRKAVEERRNRDPLLDRIVFTD
jgi:hypothetical protein